MKSLEKDRTRRYESAGGMARDIQRYLQDEPVEASPALSRVSPAENSPGNIVVPLRAAATFALLLATSAAVSTWQAWKAMAAERRAAVRAAGRSRTAESRRRLCSASCRTRSSPRPAPIGRPSGSRPGRDVPPGTRQRVAVRGARLRRPAAGRSPLRMTLGMSFWYLGDDRTAADQFRRARRIFTDRLGPDHPDTLESMHDLSNRAVPHLATSPRRSNFVKKRSSGGLPGLAPSTSIRSEAASRWPAATRSSTATMTPSSSTYRRWR